MTRSPRFRAWPAAILAAIAVALAPVSALAADGADRDTAMIWTTAVVVLSLFACAVGYAYRRMRGMDHPTPDELEMAGGHGHDDHDEALHPHAAAEHAVPGAAGQH